MSVSAYDRLQKFIVKAIPLTIYVESVTSIVITKGYAQVYDSTGFTTSLYYIYLASVYGLQILRAIFTKFIKGYSRGFWIHIAITVQFALHLVLVIGVLIYIDYQIGDDWIYWELYTFLLLFTFVSAIRLTFILIISLKVLRKNTNNLKTKQMYWLTLTTKDELFENDGKLCYDPAADLEEYQRSIMEHEHSEKYDR